MNLLAFAHVVLVLTALLFTADAQCPSGVTLNIAAHEDDDLIFMSPDIITDIEAGKCVRTIFITRGDAGGGEDYWLSREEGIRQAYALMAAGNEASNWGLETDVGIQGRNIALFTLAAAPKVSVLFLRLPDGNPGGSGYASNGFQSIQKLWEGSITRINSADGSSYTKAELISTLASLMVNYQPDTIRTLDHVGTYENSGDHSDHMTTAYLTLAAHLQYGRNHVLISYQGYGVNDRPRNVVEPLLTKKLNACRAYARYDDPGICDNDWMYRQYKLDTTVVGPAPTPTPPTPTTPTPTPPSPTPPPPGSANVASLASVTASSEDESTGQTADKAVDGSTLGYPDDSTKEWATVGGGAGSWLQLTWSSPQLLSRIVLYDRPNLDDEVTGAELTFSDNSKVTVGPMANGGTAVEVTFPLKTTTSLRFTITSVSTSTVNVGLAEIEAWTAPSKRTLRGRDMT